MKMMTKFLRDGRVYKGYYSASKAKRNEMAKSILQFVRRKYPDAFMVRGAFETTIEINVPKSKNSITQYSIVVE
jgi:hypothetical protein